VSRLPRRTVVSRLLRRRRGSRLMRGCWCRPARAGSLRFSSSDSVRLPASSRPPSH
jgi:hypothetical protein